MVIGSLYVIIGDVTIIPVDAIVNAANTSLLGGRGVDGGIHAAAGPGLLDECIGLGGCETGKAKITGAYRLPAKYVIHTPGPIWYGGTRGEDELLRSSYNSCLELAEAHGCRSISFPSISTGAYRFPLERAAGIAINTIASFLETHKLPEKVLMVCHGERTLAAYSAAQKARGLSNPD